MRARRGRMKNKHGNIPRGRAPSYSFAINCLPREQSHFAVPNIITYLNHRSIAEYLQRGEAARAFRSTTRRSSARFRLFDNATRERFSRKYAVLLTERDDHSVGKKMILRMELSGERRLLELVGGGRRRYMG